MVVGIISPEGRRTISYGHTGQNDARPLDGDTVFEIGSVSKVFTALLLAEMVQRHEVALEDPVAKYLPAGVKIPERNGRSITLLDLATHTSSLPFMPEEPAASSDAAAAKDDSAARIYKFLAAYKLQRDIGSQWDYSNLGYWLLGQALASRAGTDFESLLRMRVIAPLKLTSTAITPTSQMKARFAVGYNAALEPAPHFPEVPMYASMASAGGLASTADDLLTFLAETMSYERSPLSAAMASMLATKRPKLTSGESQVLGWVVVGEGDAQFYVHDGGSFGYSSSVAWDPKQRVGVVVLVNHVTGVGDVARHLLRPDIPLVKPTATKRTEVVLASGALDSYAGRYDAKEEGIFIVTHEGEFLMFEAPSDWGLPKLRIRPENQRDFFAAELPLRVTFHVSSDGRVNGMIIYPPRGQKTIPAERLSSQK